MFAKTGPRGEPMATPSFCLYIFPSKLNSTPLSRTVRRRRRRLSLSALCWSGARCMMCILTQRRRCNANDMINYIWDEWMAWHQKTSDFSLLEVNWPLIGGLKYRIHPTSMILAFLQELQLASGHIGYECRKCTPIFAGVECCLHI